MEIKVPELGESISEGTISAWMKKEGEPVKFGDLLLELETDKVNMEITAEGNGILEKILKQEGDNVKPGEIIGTIRVQDEASPGAAAQAKEAGQANEAVHAAEAVQIHEDARSPQRDDNSVSNNAPPEEGGDHAYTASPAVRKLARERGLDLNRVNPADPMGRISRRDIDGLPAAVPHEHSKSETGQLGPKTGETMDKGPVGDESFAAGKPVERKRMSRRRLTIARHLVEAQRTAAMLTTFNEVDMTAILDIRKRRKLSFQEKHEVGLGFMSFFSKAVVGALKAFPMLNAELDGEDLILKKYYDIGIAVAAKEGLVVPVVRGADRLTFAEIEKRIAELAAKARSNTLALSDLQGGTFTITNGGVFGSLLSTPILNAPQVGILGMHTIQKRPVAIDDEKMENRPMMYIALSYDHRVVDGSEAVRFLVTVKELLEDPESLLLEG